MLSDEQKAEVARRVEAEMPPGNYGELSGFADWNTMAGHYVLWVAGTGVLDGGGDKRKVVTLAKTIQVAHEAELASAREAALREGAEAMRECIVYRIWGHEWRDPDDLVRQIRALPLPEVK